jgi:hypothetical protein
MWNQGKPERTLDRQKGNQKNASQYPFPQKHKKGSQKDYCAFQKVKSSIRNGKPVTPTRIWVMRCGLAIG